jgi:hypothetical protein
MRYPPRRPSQRTIAAYRDALHSMFGHRPGAKSLRLPFEGGSRPASGASRFKSSGEGGQIQSPQHYRDWAGAVHSCVGLDFVGPYREPR